MKKVYKKLSEEDKKEGVIFSSCLSVGRTEQAGDNIHKVLDSEEDKIGKIERLKDDSFFNKSCWNYNIIRE